MRRIEAAVKDHERFEQLKAFFDANFHLIREEFLDGYSCTVYVDQSGEIYRKSTSGRLSKEVVIDYWALAAVEGWIPDPTVGRGPTP